jgi:hypothetical protein
LLLQILEILLVLLQFLDGTELLELELGDLLTGFLQLLLQRVDR